MNEDGSRARGVIGVVLAGALLIIILSLIFYAPRPEVKDYLTLLIGALIANVTSIIQFYFGSSSGAKQLVANQNEIVKAAAAATVAASASPIGGKDAPSGTPDDPVSVTETKPAPEDPGLVSLRGYVRSLNPTATEEDIKSAWGRFRPAVDVDLGKA